MHREWPWIAKITIFFANFLYCEMQLDASKVFFIKMHVNVGMRRNALFASFCVRCPPIAKKLQKMINYIYPKSFCNLYKISMV
jgi:hypothetical protein